MFGPSENPSKHVLQQRSTKPLRITSGAMAPTTRPLIVIAHIRLFPTILIAANWPYSDQPSQLHALVGEKRRRRLQFTTL